MLMGILAGLIATLIFQTLMERADRVSQWLLRVSVRLLPENIRDVRHEQWSADVYYIDGKVSKILGALGCSSVCVNIWIRKAILSRKDKATRIFLCVAITPAMLVLMIFMLPFHLWTERKHGSLGIFKILLTAGGLNPWRMTNHWLDTLTESGRSNPKDKE